MASSTEQPSAVWTRRSKVRRWTPIAIATSSIAKTLPPCRRIQNDIQATVGFAGAQAQSALAWMVTGPSLTSWNGPGEEMAVRETRTAEPVAITQGQVACTFAARSLTALDIRLAR